MNSESRPKTKAILASIALLLLAIGMLLLIVWKTVTIGDTNTGEQAADWSTTASTQERLERYHTMARDLGAETEACFQAKKKAEAHRIGQQTIDMYNKALSFTTEETAKDRGKKLVVLEELADIQSRLIEPDRVFITLNDAIRISTTPDGKPTIQAILGISQQGLVCKQFAKTCHPHSRMQLDSLEAAFQKFSASSILAKNYKSSTEIESWLIMPKTYKQMSLLDLSKINELGKGEVLFLQAKFKDAIPHLKEYLCLSTKKENKDYLSAAKALAECYRKVGKPLEAQKIDRLSGD